MCESDPFPFSVLSVYLMDVTTVTTHDQVSLSIFAFNKRSKTRGGSGLGMRLTFFPTLSYVGR